MSRTSDQKHFTIAYVAADFWYELQIPYPLPVLVNSWTCSAASRHTTTPNQPQQAPHPIACKLLLISILLWLGG